MKKWRYSILALAGLTWCMLACQPVKPYQRAYLNDHEMQPGRHGARLFEENVQVYREGASGGGGGKSSGGCGCN